MYAGRARPNNTPMNIDIANMTDEAIKSLAYDQIVALEQAQKNLRICNDELLRRKTALGADDHPKD